MIILTFFEKIEVLYLWKSTKILIKPGAKKKQKALTHTYTYQSSLQRDIQWLPENSEIRRRLSYLSYDFE